MFIRFDTTRECDRWTDRQTDRQTPHDDIGRACLALRSKNDKDSQFHLLC